MPNTFTPSACVCVCLCVCDGRLRTLWKRESTGETRVLIRAVNRSTEQKECVGQFNLIGFVDDLSLVAQSLGGTQALLNTIQKFELWCGLKVNRKKTCAMVIERLGAGQRQLRETLVYMGQAVTFLAPSMS
jgi:hypothetical protein